jgi:hypothetical protein
MDPAPKDGPLLFVSEPSSTISCIVIGRRKWQVQPDILICLHSRRLRFVKPILHVTGTADALSPEEQQENWLQEGKAVVKQQAFLMKRALDNSNLKDALKYSSNMLCELRTGLLSPKNYYELYMMVISQLFCL